MPTIKKLHFIVTVPEDDLDKILATMDPDGERPELEHDDALIEALKHSGVSADVYPLTEKELDALGAAREVLAGVLEFTK